VPGITPAHPPPLFDHQPRQRHSSRGARPSTSPGHLRCQHNAGGSSKARRLPGSVSRFHTRSITLAEPARLGTARRDRRIPVAAKADVT
jgi:hypothetical protein